MGFKSSLLAAFSGGSSKKRSEAKPSRLGEENGSSPLVPKRLLSPAAGGSSTRGGALADLSATGTVSLPAENIVGLPPARWRRRRLPAAVAGC